MAFDNPYQNLETDTYEEAVKKKREAEADFTGGIGSNPFNYAGPQPQQTAYAAQTAREDAYEDAYEDVYVAAAASAGHYSKSLNGFISERNVLVCMLLCFLTFGLYHIYWVYKINNEVNYLSGEPNALSGGWVLFWDFFTLGWFSFYWHYIMGERMDRMRWKAGSGSSILFLIFRIAHVPLINLAIAQFHINHVVRPGF